MAGENFADIAANYRIPQSKLIENNGYMQNEQLTPGEELLVVVPTRTYTVKEGDTLFQIARRFNVKKSELIATNPDLCGGDKTYVGQILTVKCQRQNLGMTAANGYLSPSTPRKALYRALPYLVYVTVASAITDGESIHCQKISFDAVGEVKKHGKIPLLRIYDGTGGAFLSSKASREELPERVVEAAQQGGYSGVVFASPRAASEFASEYADFIFETRKRMIGSELIFFTECDEFAKAECVDLADGNILVYSKIDVSAPKSFDEAEKNVLTRFAECAESSKTFIDLLSHGFDGKRFIPFGKMNRIFRERDAEITHDESTLLARINTKKESIVYETLENLKAKLEIVGELGFMGINIDIENAPINQLMLYHTMFTSVSYNPFYSGG